MIEHLPTAPAGEVVALDGAFFNRLMGIISSVANLTVTPPLLLRDGPAGRVISITRLSTPCLVKPTSTVTRPGTYNGRIWITNILQASSIDISSGSALTSADFGKDPGADNCYCFNRQETSTGHALTVPFTLPCPGTIFGIYTDGKLCVAIDQC
jgi:hypothetical protein